MNSQFRVWHPKERVVTPMVCPECGNKSEDEYCGECGLLLHPDYIRERRDGQFKEWANSLSVGLSDA
jgi:predicted amidophosphoribosyltransferase